MYFKNKLKKIFYLSIFLDISLFLLSIFSLFILNNKFLVAVCILGYFIISQLSIGEVNRIYDDANALHNSKLLSRSFIYHFIAFLMFFLTYWMILSINRFGY